VQFAKELRERIRRGHITCTVRIWTSPHVKVGGRYRMEGGEVEVTSIRSITLEDVTPELARRSGFKGVVDLLKIARHGAGRNVYLIEFRYGERSAAGAAPKPQRKSASQSRRR
jgi:hypothetical protein